MSFIDNCFKTFVDKLFIGRPQFITVEKKTLFLSLPYLGEISLQTRTNLRKSLKDFKDHLPSDLVFGVVYKHTCGRCNSTYYGETDRHLKVDRENILGYHFWRLRRLNHQMRVQFTTIFWIAITSRLLRSLLFWDTGIIISILKSKKIYLSNEIDLFWIKALVLLNFFFHNS